MDQGSSAGGNSMTKLQDALDAVDDARYEVRTIHPEMSTPMLFAALQGACLRILHTQEELLYQLDQQVRLNEALTRVIEDG